MHLSDQESALYYELMWALQFHIKQSLNLFPKVKTIRQYADNLDMEEKFEVREALYADPTWFDTFVQRNPQNFSEEKLAIVQSWKAFVAGDFFIERILKKYTIFIADNNNVYGVWAIQDDFDDIFHPGELPVRVRAVLLPFQDKIIYDGLLQSYNVFFGSGISGDLKEIYLRAKQRNKIIEILIPSDSQSKSSAPEKPQKDWAPELKDLLEKASKLRGGSGQPPIYSPIFSLIKASLELGHTAALDPNDEEQLWKQFAKVEQALRKIERSL
jgi:hypothetical protein